MDQWNRTESPEIYTHAETSAQGWCTGNTQRDGMEREAGEGDGEGEHM